MMSDERLRTLLIRHEAMELKPYTDATGNLTIGIGRNLTAKGITRAEALFLLENDIEDVKREAGNLPWFAALSPARQDAVLSMIFNLGMAGFLAFRETIAAIQRQDFTRAALYMLNSTWARQVGRRATELSQMLQTGNYLD